MRTPRFLLIHSPCDAIDDDTLEPPMGILMLGTVLQEKGYRVEICDLSGLSPEACLNVLERCEPAEVVGFSTFTVSYHTTLALVKHIRAILPDAKLIAGGPHASALPEEVVSHFDYVFVGESEQEILAFASTFPGVPSVIYCAPVTKLDELPVIDYSLIDLEKYTRRMNDQMCLSVLTSRGCPYDCAFCNSRVASRGRKFLRLRGPEHVASEITYLHRRYQIDHIRFQDDLFTISAERIREIARLSPPFQYRCFARSNTLTDQMCLTLRETGCNHVAIGVESGSPEILKAMDKRVTPNIIRRGLINAHRYGLRTRIYLIVGFPGETDATIQQTMDFLDTVPFDEFMIYPVIPYPGTPLYHNPEKYDITWIDPDFSQYVQIGKKRTTGYVMRTSSYGPREIQQWRDELINYLELRGAVWYDSTLKLDSTKLESTGALK